MIGSQEGSKASSPPGSAVVDPRGEMLACSSFGTATSPPLSANSGERCPSTKAPHPSQLLKCPRCESPDTKFCYYNNYSLTQPRYFCKNCKRYWTAGGALRNVPVGGGLRKNKRSKLKLAAADAVAVFAAQGLGVQHQYQAKPVSCAPLEITAETLKIPHATSISCAPGGTNLAGIESELYTSDSSRRAHSSRVSSSAEHGGAVTLDYGGSDACGAVSSDHHTGCNFYGEARHLPQFYSSSYSTSLPCSHQYTNEAPSYVVNYNFLPPSNDSILLRPNDATGANASDNHGANSMISGKSLSRDEIKQESDEGTVSNPYDWQLISEGLFNGAGDGFLYLPQGSWPNFSEFNDTGA